VALHLAGKKGIRIPPVTNQSPRGGPSLCVDVNSPKRSSKRTAVGAVVRATPGGLGQGVFWWEPCVQSRLRTRGYFDNDNNVLPVIRTFDPAQ